MYLTAGWLHPLLPYILTTPPAHTCIRCHLFVLCRLVVRPGCSSVYAKRQMTEENNKPPSSSIFMQLSPSPSQTGRCPADSFLCFNIIMWSADRRLSSGRIPESTQVLSGVVSRPPDCSWKIKSKSKHLQVQHAQREGMRLPFGFSAGVMTLLGLMEKHWAMAERTISENDSLLKPTSMSTIPDDYYKNKPVKLFCTGNEKAPSVVI